jgi:hypothetical protein
MTKLAFSYSHVDERLRDELQKHLMALQRQGLIDTWHDRRIQAGQEWRGQIDQSFEDADVILLLVSPDFIASNYCYDIEMQRALERHEERSAVVIPVILRPCHWTDLPFGKLQAATKDEKPVLHYSSLDDGFYEVVQRIKEALPTTAKAVQERSPRVVVAPEGATSGKGKPVPARSSALSIKQEFSDLERDQALADGYKAIVAI